MIDKMRSIKRCEWVNMKNPVYIDYHDNEWGRPLHDDRGLYELLILESFQAGLSWECVLNKRRNFRDAFDNFDINLICTYGQEKISSLLENSEIIRNRLKIDAAVGNSLIFLEIQSQFGSFDRYIWSFTDYSTIYCPFNLASKSCLSDEISKDLKRRGMKFVGSTIVYSYLQAVGVINAHGTDCFCYVNKNHEL